jgi:hypothetical protein
MMRVSSWALRGLACAVLLFASAVLVRAAGEPAAVTEGKRLIDANADNICRFAHAYSSYGYKSHEYLGSTKTKDGYYEMTFLFTVKGNIKTQTMLMAFYFKESGEFNFLRVRKYTTIYEPFTRLSNSYLKQLREQMAKRPVVQSNSELLRAADTASAQDLCEMHLKLSQLNLRP